MREATGELNLTVIVVVAVAGLMAFFSIVVWPTIKAGMKRDANCSDAICTGTPSNGMVTCHMKGETETFKCPYKG